MLDEFAEINEDIDEAINKEEEERRKKEKDKNDKS